VPVPSRITLKRGKKKMGRNGLENKEKVLIVLGGKIGLLLYCTLHFL
jgi:NADPH-dependent 2,4-dienoyl-CoA reductase/sulfur reductase-like enzyme